MKLLASILLFSTLLLHGCSSLSVGGGVSGGSGGNVDMGVGVGIQL